MQVFYLFRWYGVKLNVITALSYKKKHFGGFLFNYSKNETVLNALGYINYFIRRKTFLKL